MNLLSRLSAATLRQIQHGKVVTTIDRVLLHAVGQELSSRYDPTVPYGTSKQSVSELLSEYLDKLPTSVFIPSSSAATTASGRCAARKALKA